MTRKVTNAVIASAAGALLVLAVSFLFRSAFANVAKLPPIVAEHGIKIASLEIRQGNLREVLLEQKKDTNERFDRLDANNRAIIQRLDRLAENRYGEEN